MLPLMETGGVPSKPPATTLVQHRRYRAVLRDDGGFQLHVSPHAASMTGTP